MAKVGASRVCSGSKTVPNGSGSWGLQWGLNSNVQEDPSTVHEGSRLLQNSELACTEDGSIDFLGKPSIKSKTGGWSACPFILGNECCERLAFYGINTNLVTYLIKEYHQGNAVAARNVTIWSGTGYVTPMIGAVVADTFLGRYRTIGTFSSLYFLGLVLLTISASSPLLKPTSCVDNSSCQPSVWQLSFFFVALYCVAFGMGGIKPCISAFGADQFDSHDPVERKKKGHFFNWFYMSVNLGGLVATTVLVYIQDNHSWALGFGIPAVFMAISIFFFFLGTPLYRHQKAKGSPFVRIAQVLVAASRKWYLSVPSDRRLLHGSHGKESSHLSNDFRFMEKAAIAIDTDNRKGFLPGSWKLCNISQVEEVKMAMRVLPIWATNIMFTTVYSQISTTFVEQGSKMDTSFFNFTISPASMSTFEILTVILMVPVYDRILIKLARRISGHPQGISQLRRMGIGMFISILSMLVASVVESKRLGMANAHRLTLPVNQPVSVPVTMSIFWQLPQIVLLGIAETFTYIGQLEFFYEQVPDSMRSMGTAVALTTFGLGNYLNGLLLVVVSMVGNPGWIPDDDLNRGHLNYYFNLIAFLSTVNLVLYIICSRSFRYRERVLL